jgi:hypothetical protein
MHQCIIYFFFLSQFFGARKITVADMMQQLFLSDSPFPATEKKSFLN